MMMNVYTYQSFLMPFVIPPVLPLLSSPVPKSIDVLSASIDHLPFLQFYMMASYIICLAFHSAID